MKKQNFFTRLFSGESKSFDSQALRSELLGWHESGKVNTLLHRGDNQLENGYGSIQAITKQFFNAVPYAIDAKGKRLKQSNVTDILGHPSKDMSGLDFREALALMNLIHNKVYVRVWHSGTKVTERSIRGFTFLEGVHEIEEKGQVVYQTPDGSIYTEDEVIVLKNINPYDLSKGYSVANAVRRWANIDDYIAAYQSGFFENGAVPAGQFVISTPNTEDFTDIVGKMKQVHQGAGKNNNVVYTHAPVDPVTGKPLASNINWVPYNTTNNDLALEAIFDQVNHKLDSAYGVPATMRGVNENHTITGVRVDQEIFIDNTVRPFANKIWTRFTHELNRITGGLGYAIVVDIETPHIAEEEKQFAEAQSTSTSTLLSLVNAGYTLESSITALQLDESFLELEKEKVEAPVVEEEEVNDDTTAVDEGDEVEDAPEEESKSLEAVDVRCKHCNSYLFKATGTTVVEDMNCPKCKGTNNFKIINPLGDDHTHKFTFTEKQPKNWKIVAQSRALSDEQTALITNKIAQTMRKQMEGQIDRVDVKSKKLSDADRGSVELYAKEIVSIVEPLITSEGMKQKLIARTITGLEEENLSEFKLDETQMKKYLTYLEGIVKGYAEDTQIEIRKVLADGIGNNLPVSEVKKNLSNIMNTDEYRVQRLALTETNRAGNAGSIYAMEQVGKETGLKIAKVWQTRGSACQYCKALEGTEVDIADAFVEEGGEIHGTDGGTMTNNFVAMDVPTAHPNCGCYTTYKVIKD